LKNPRHLHQLLVVCHTPDSVVHLSKQSIHLFTASLQKPTPPPHRLEGNQRSEGGSQ
jgi:hypothetical protein